MGDLEVWMEAVSAVANREAMWFSSNTIKYYATIMKDIDPRTFQTINVEERVSENKLPEIPLPMLLALQKYLKDESRKSRTAKSIVAEAIEKSHKPEKLFNDILQIISTVYECESIEEVPKQKFLNDVASSRETWREIVVKINNSLVASYIQDLAVDALDVLPKPGNPATFSKVIRANHLGIWRRHANAEENTKDFVIKGHVRKPGRYSLPEFASFQTIVDEAGGYSIRADTELCKEFRDEHFGFGVYNVPALPILIWTRDGQNTHSFLLDSLPKPLDLPSPLEQQPHSAQPWRLTELIMRAMHTLKQAILGGRSLESPTSPSESYLKEPIKSSLLEV
eukprot:TRINITY_DN3723_c0_g1_i1.p1 TRINITY_DN3723_c0_g1~~TRINITY_DN3723_c0_g1_i1.p1  ORF type:complete len:338 (-),score=72.09 TRINITY_DN3723_c0_g1_i1:39-1052(-)